MGSDNNNDKELVARAKEGDTQAFDVLVRKYQYKVLNLVGRYVQGDEAQDVAQEAFIRAYRGLKNFRGDSAFYTWLYRVAVNSAKNYLMSSGKRKRKQQGDIDDAEYFDEASLLRDQHTREHMLQTDELEVKVFEAISSLPEDLKIALTLREMDGMSYEDIADTVGCPIGTVRSRIFRAREALDKVIKPLID